MSRLSLKAKNHNRVHNNSPSTDTIKPSQSTPHPICWRTIVISYFLCPAIPSADFLTKMLNTLLSPPHESSSIDLIMSTLHYKRSEKSAVPRNRISNILSISSFPNTANCVLRSETRFTLTRDITWKCKISWRVLFPFHYEQRLLYTAT
jgi:hypothetical protein